MNNVAMRGTPAPEATFGTPFRPVSPPGTVHEFAKRTEHGYPLTLCGLRVGRGWGKTRQRPPRPIDCNRCRLALRKLERPTRRKGQPVAITWDDAGVGALVSGGRDKDPYRVGAA